MFDLVFRVGPAIKAIFELGYEPKEELFYELTSEQYANLAKEGQYRPGTWYTIIPNNPKYDGSELLIVDNNQKKALLDAARYINKLCDKPEIENRFSSFEDKLKYAAGQLPTVFSESSKFVRYQHAPDLKIVK